MRCRRVVFLYLLVVLAVLFLPRGVGLAPATADSVYDPPDGAPPWWRQDQSNPYWLYKWDIDWTGGAPALRIAGSAGNYVPSPPMPDGNPYGSDVGSGLYWWSRWDAGSMQLRIVVNDTYSSVMDKQVYEWQDCDGTANRVAWPTLTADSTEKVVGPDKQVFSGPLRVSSLWDVQPQPEWVMLTWDFDQGEQWQLPPHIAVGVACTPELPPSALALLAMGPVALARLRRRKR